MKFFQLTIALFLSMLISCKKDHPQDETAKTTTSDIVVLSDQQSKIAAIEIGGLQTKTLNGTISATGTLDVPPQNLVDISAPMGGFVKNTSLLQGMKVKKGDILIELQHQDYIQLQQDYLNSVSQLTYLEAEYNRQLDLAKENVNAQKTLQQSRAQFESMRVNVQGLKAKLSWLNISEEQLQHGEIQNFIRLYSPINGYVTEVNVNIGKFVAPSDVMVKLVNTEHIHVELRVFEKDFTKLREGQKVKFHLVNELTEREAEVYLIGHEITPERTIRIHCHIKKEDPKLLPGMFINATIETDQETIAVLPDEAIVNHEGKNFVFVPGKIKNEFRLVPVETSLQQDGFTAVNLSPAIQADTKFVVKGAYTLLSIMFNTEE
jgi:cobalt-zinc-cadmium efflux system membrane fusion protein